MTQRKPKNSSKVNFTVSAIFHTVLIGGIAFLAAREGMLGTKLKTLAATIVPKDKPKPEQPKEKPPEPKAEPPKLAQEKRPDTAPPPRVESTAPPPVDNGPAAAAPEAAIVSDFNFNDGAKEVITDPNVVYKQVVERALRAQWSRPEDMEDSEFTAEAELSVDPAGKVQGYRWVKGSGSVRWDDSVKGALAATKAVGQRPPKGFPSKFTVRFDVQVTQAEDVIQVGSTQ